jgi:hypothetical protein
MPATIAELRTLGYSGFAVHCDRCKVSLVVPYDDFADHLVAVDVMAKFICSRCDRRPNVTSFNARTANMRP